MYLERWVEHPFSDTETWLVNGCLLITVSHREVIELITGTYHDFLLLKLAPLVFLSVPVHDIPKIPLTLLREKAHEIAQKEY